MRLPLDLLPPGSRPFDVVGLGQNSVDLVAHVSRFPLPNSKQRVRHLERLPGGQVASAMVCCARLGWRARYLGTMGDDEAGRLGLETLAGEGVDVTGVLVRPGARSRTATIIVEPDRGERTVLWDRDGRLALSAAELPPGAAASGRVLLVDTEDLDASTGAAAGARASGAITVVDAEAVEPGLEELLAHIDVMILSEGLPGQLTGERDPARALRAVASRFRPAIACVTLGEHGCAARCGDREWRVPAFPIACVDSTGAGDAFRGGFIAGLLEGAGAATVEAVLRYANAVAALNCRATGAQRGLPRRAEVEALLGDARPGSTA